MLEKKTDESEGGRKGVGRMVGGGSRRRGLEEEKDGGVKGYKEIKFTVAQPRPLATGLNSTCISTGAGPNGHFQGEEFPMAAGVG